MPDDPDDTSVRGPLVCGARLWLHRAHGPATYVAVCTLEPWHTGRHSSAFHGGYSLGSPSHERLEWETDRV